MPATGHALTLFQSLFNWGSLFGGSPLAKDAAAMIATFSDPTKVGHLIVSLPEEMPLVEGLELRSQLARLFSSAECEFVVNRRFPDPGTNAEYPEDRPFAATISEHAARKAKLERDNLEIWRDVSYIQIPFHPPELEQSETKTSADVEADLRREMAS